jgi:hypothetical protein
MAVLLLAATLAGCGATFSFKPGAGPDRMSSDEHQCGQAGDEGFVECMRSLGWYVSDGEIGSAPTVTPIVAAAEVPSAAPPAVTPAALKVAPPTVAAPSPAAEPERAIAVEAPVATPPAAVEASAAPSPLPTATHIVPAPAVQAPGPGGETLPRVRVGSWWKFGGSAAALDASVAACVAKLGPPHQPDRGAIVVTVALRDCLKAEGWYAADVKPMQ